MADTRQDSNRPKSTVKDILEIWQQNRIPWRKNVLALIGIGYFTLLAMFWAMVWKGGMTADAAYEVVKGPLMALIGGSLAISKDLIPIGDRGQLKNTKQAKQDQQNRQDETATDKHEHE